MAALLVAALLLTLVPATSAMAAAGLVSDDFNGVLDSSVWSVVDPVGDGSVTTVGAGSGDARLELAVPGGVSHDVWGANKSLRMMQSVVDADFEVEATFDSVPSQKYQMQGVLVEQDAGNWLRFDFYHDGSSLRVFAGSTAGGVSSGQLNTKLGSVSAGSVSLRVTRVADEWTLAWSDGSGWSTVGAFSRALTVSSVGVFAGNHHSTVSRTPAFTAAVDYFFDTAAPVSPEDDPNAVQRFTLATDVVGQGTVAVSPEAADYVEGETVEVTATAASGWTFTGWSGDLSGTDNPASVVMDANKSVTATFEEASADTTAPVVSGVAVSTTASSATVTWTTDESASSSVAYGPSSAYEDGTVDDGSLVTEHSVTLTGLLADTTYHYAVTSVDAVGNTTTTTTDDATFTTNSAQTGTGPTIDVWYADTQTFGSPAEPQTWVNILGNVSPAASVASLGYTLNGGSPSGLTVGPDNRRLQAEGDFNAEISYSDLQSGANEVVITAEDTDGNVSTAAVTIQYDGGNSLSLPYTADWATAGKISDVAQVIDGLWTLESGTVRTVETGYDRLIGVGDIGWTDYEVEMPVTVHGIGPYANSYLHGAPLVGLALRWRGHTEATANRQPRYGWWPTGALGWFKYSDTHQIELFGNNNTPSARKKPASLPFGVAHVVKAQVETVPTGTTYRMKIWEQGTAEPEKWDVSITDDDSPSSGSVVIIAHDVDASFGAVIVRPLPN
jgi:uncharacterized repeat protein (TIGR02543 family)